MKSSSRDDCWISEGLNVKPSGRTKSNSKPLTISVLTKLISIDSFKEKVIKKLEWWNESQEGAEFVNEISFKEKILRRTLARESPFLQEFIVDTSHIPSILKWMFQPFSRKPESAISCKPGN